MHYICSLIVVSDIEKSRDFYEEVLDQTVKYDFGENVSFEGDFSIHLEEHYKGLLDNDDIEIKKGSNSFELYFETHDMDGDYERISEYGVEFVHELQEQPWGQRVARFYDPDRHIIELGETMEAVVWRCKKAGMTVEEASERTSMPLEFAEMVYNGEEPN